VAAARLPAINLAASGAGGVTGNLPNAQVAGLGSAALEPTTAFDAAGAAATAQSNAETFSANASNLTSGTVAIARLPTGIPNSNLANSTISGIALGSNLDTLTIDATHLTGISYNGSAPVTIATDATSADTASTIVARDAAGSVGVTNVNLSSGINFGTYSVGSNPQYVAVDQSGNVWVANYGSATVTKLSSAGATLGTYSVGSNPQYVAVDQSGNVWVTNAGSNNVTKLSSAGATLGTYSVGIYPQDVAVDQSGNVWVANFSSANVTKLSSAGATLGTYSVGSNPVGVAVDQSGNVWVTNAGSNNVTKLSSAGATLGTYSVGSNPQYVAVDQSGNVWVANPGSNNVTKLSSAGATLGTYSVGSSPQDVAVDRSGNVWVANFSSANVTKLSSAGATLGTYSVGSNPVGVAVDQSGNVWVTNYGSANVTKLSSGSSGVLAPLVQNLPQASGPAITPTSVSINGGTPITAQTGTGGTVVMSASPALTNVGIAGGYASFNSGNLVVGTSCTASLGTNCNPFQIESVGSYWNGSSASNDIWGIADQLGAGTNPTSTLVIGKITGSTGAATVSVPHLGAFGTAVALSGTGGTPTCTAGTCLDMRGRLTVPSATTAAVVTFGTAYGSAPVCTVTQNGGATFFIPAWSSTTTALTITTGITLTTGEEFDYTCIQ
jgi:streptogramin lyase